VAEPAGPLDLEHVEQGEQVVGESLLREVPVRGLTAPPEPAQVGADQPVAPGQRGDDAAPRPPVLRPAVDQQQRRRRRVAGFRDMKLDAGRQVMLRVTDAGNGRHVEVHGGSAYDPLNERDEVVLKKKSTLDEAKRLMQAAALFTLVLWLFHDGTTAVELDASDVMVIWGATFALMTLLRAGVRRLVGTVASPERCLIVGEPDAIDAVRRKLERGRVNAEVVGSLVLDGPSTPSGELLGGFARLLDIHGVERAIIAPAAGWDDTVPLVRLAKHAGVRVSAVPRMFEVVGSSVELDHLDGLTTLGIRRFGLTRSSHAIKRSFDLLGSSLLLLAVAPVMAAIGLAVKLGSRGPVFFRQVRVGKDGARFEMLKFRSMVADADERKEELRHLSIREGLFKIPGDPRITRVGAFLRRTSLDELPQLLNVWRGEMSLVGPRPLIVDEDARVEGYDRHRLHLTPGMTGDWQILGSSRIPMHEMVGIDYLYVANWSLWTDVKILLRTIPYVLSSRGM
jgi:exopolysaccharide biosynthesis polyprenyl glycosylphosphotransferase